MPLATQADLEARIGPVRLQELLAHVVDPSADDTTKAAQRTAALDNALEGGDRLVSQFLEVPESDPPDVLIGHAADEAIYCLRKHAKLGPSEADAMCAQERRIDLAKMRAREQMPGTPDRQRSEAGRPGVVKSTDWWTEEERGLL